MSGCFRSCTSDDAVKNVEVPVVNATVNEATDDAGADADLDEGEDVSCCERCKRECSELVGPQQDNTITDQERVMLNSYLAKNRFMQFVLITSPVILGLLYSYVMIYLTS
jgi:hypothetical protein